MIGWMSGHMNARVNKRRSIMNTKETLVILGIIRAAYFDAFSKLKPADAGYVAEIWQDQFAEVDYKLVRAAVDMYIAEDEKGFPPKPGQIRANIRFIISPERKTAAELWRPMWKALNEARVNPSKAFESLPPVLKEFVEKTQNMMLYSGMDNITIETSLYKRFEKFYEKRCETEERLSALSALGRECRAEALAEQGSKMLPETGSGSGNELAVKPELCEES